MYQFDFVIYAEDDEQKDHIISILSTSYPDAVVKMSNLNLPDYKFSDYKLEAVYEVGTFQSHMN